MVTRLKQQTYSKRSSARHRQRGTWRWKSQYLTLPYAVRSLRVNQAEQKKVTLNQVLSNKYIYTKQYTQTVWAFEYIWSLTTQVWRIYVPVDEFVDVSSYKDRNQYNVKKSMWYCGTSISIPWRSIPCIFFACALRIRLIQLLARMLQFSKRGPRLSRTPRRRLCWMQSQKQTRHGSMPLYTIVQFSMWQADDGLYMFCFWLEFQKDIRKS